MGRPDCDSPTAAHPGKVKAATLNGSCRIRSTALCGSPATRHGVDAAQPTRTRPGPRVAAIRQHPGIYYTNAGVSPGAGSADSGTGLRSSRSASAL